MADPKTILDWAVSYGLGTLLAVGMALAFWHILLYVLKENSKREDRLASIIEGHLGQLTQSTNRIAESIQATEARFNELREANKMQREEHKAIADKLLEVGKILQTLEQRLEIISR